MYIAPGQGQTTLGDTILMSTEIPYHFADYANRWEVREMRVKGMTFEGSGTTTPRPCNLLSLIPGKLVIFFSVLFSCLYPSRLLDLAEEESLSYQNCLLVSRQNDNHSAETGPGRRETSPLLSSEKCLFCFVLEFYGPVNNDFMSSQSVNSGTVPGQA